ncbi:MAG: hypothetical protein OEW75_18710 [Cyclobacteriaceae bacterium]|nr:hypothetical protein [Cyclobacteriaceae bacterium]
MRYINRNRFVRGNSSASSQGGGQVSVYSEVIKLTQFFDIIQVINPTTIQIAFNQPAIFPSGQIVAIDGSIGGITPTNNDGIFEVDYSLAVFGANLMNVTFKEANLLTGLIEYGLVHIRTSIPVQHNLDTEDVAYRLKNVATGATTFVNDDSSDRNILLLKPQVPVLGDFRISIFGQKT